MTDPRPELLLSLTTTPTAEVAIATHHRRGRSARAAATGHAYLHTGVLSAAVVNRAASAEDDRRCATELADAVARFAAGSAEPDGRQQAGPDCAAERPCLRGVAWRCVVVLPSSGVEVHGTGCRAYGWSPGNGLRLLAAVEGGAADQLVIISTSHHALTRVEEEWVAVFADDPGTLAATLATTDTNAADTSVIVVRRSAAHDVDQQGGRTLPDGFGVGPLLVTRQITYHATPDPTALEHR
ncbi:hypothetical protein F4556_005041 [Kitasatospora gansuensis]|uniref:Uncharacterized protein n=1 Tax=Kitasatospora gansuensis TaxID=258050 RepID=A0A7W7SFG7_9ACTN|nr:hypothetical protein [Kitasatospora gansuensis]MBB4949506.1 hypothetical protein [Kitasatospora gansuensis]